MKTICSYIYVSEIISCLQFYMYSTTNTISEILSVNMKIALTAIWFGKAASDPQKWKVDYSAESFDFFFITASERKRKREKEISWTSRMYGDIIGDAIIYIFWEKLMHNKN